MSAAHSPDPASELDRALDGIILGTLSRRGVHDLGDHAERFRERLEALGFRLRRVKELSPTLTLRIPAFLVRGNTAFFGHVFFEKFTDTAKRQIFGSVVRDESGDWDIILGRSSPEMIHACPGRATSYDPDRPD